MNRSGCCGDRINKRMVGSELVHLQTADADRIYFLAAVLAYLLRRVDPRSRFPSDFRTLIGKFPVALNMTQKAQWDSWRDGATRSWHPSPQP